MLWGNLVDASGLPGQLPPTARLRMMKNGWSKTHLPPAGHCEELKVA